MQTKEHNQTADVEPESTREWRVAKAKTNLEIIDCDGDVVATIRDNWHTQAQWELARLIAAAPDGLKLAEQVIVWANACPKHIVHLAGLIIQKAEGQ